MSAVIVYITTDSTDEARRIGRRLLDTKLVACVNIIAGMHSMYWWEDRIAESKETILMAKSIDNNLELITQTVKDIHSYELPCVTAFPITGGSQEFIQWIESQCIQEKQ